jgi:hypothetical protein
MANRTREYELLKRDGSGARVSVFSGCNDAHQAAICDRWNARNIVETVPETISWPFAEG